MKVNPHKLIKAWIASIILTALIAALIVSLIIEQTYAQDNTVQATVNESISYLYKYQPTGQKPLETILKASTVEEVEEVETIKEVYTITAYCSCEKCCGEWANKRTNNIVVGAWGKELIVDYSIASPLPFGTKVKIEGLGTYEVMDRTATWIADRYNGKIIDLYFGNDHKAALEFGRQELEVEIYD